MTNVLIHNNETVDSIFKLENSNIYGKAISLCNNKYGCLGWETDSLYLENNIQHYSLYPAELSSIGTISREVYENMRNYISTDSQIVHSFYNEGTFLIEFYAPNIKKFMNIQNFFRIKTTCSSHAGKCGIRSIYR